MSFATTKQGIRRRPWLVVVLLVVCVAVAGAIGWRLQQPSTAPPDRPLALIASGDTAGWIVPCGCASNQSGGLLRRGSYVSAARAAAEVLTVDAGGAPGGTSAYHRVKFEAILQGELALGLVAHNLGGPEAALGLDYVRQVGRRLGVPFISANLRHEKGELVAEPLRIVERAGRRVALAGVLSRRYAGSGNRIDDPREALLKAAADAKGRYDTLVVLAYLPEEELQQLAAALPEADVILGGPTGQSISPRQVGPTLLASATNKGKFLLHLELGSSNHWTGKVVELGPEWTDDGEQQANVRRYLEELGRRDFPAAETGFAPDLPAALPGDYRLAGNQSCTQCHKQDCTLWETSKHAHAWQTLAERGYHVDAFCQQCHTTGYGLPGGFQSAARSQSVINVGCESCHGPSHAHVRNPKTKTTFIAQDQCARCHDRENSPTFDYASYWSRIQHGVRSLQKTTE
jgi:hypothetical protein